MSSNPHRTKAVEEIGAFLDEWMDTILQGAAAIKEGNMAFFRDIDVLRGFKRPNNNYVSKKGFRHLENAASLLLRKERLSLKLRRSTARKAILDAFAELLPKSLKKGRISEHAILDGAAKRLADVPRDDGTYVFPVVFAPRVTTTDFRIGPARLLAKPIFDEENAALLSHVRPSEEAGSERETFARWKSYVGAYDHFLTVEVEGFEAEMAWPAARDAAEFYLNLIRMVFGFRHSNRIRIGAGFIWEAERSELIIKRDGDFLLSTSFGPHGSHLPDDWMTVFDEELRHHQILLNHVLYWFVSGTHYCDPTFERLAYASKLFAEAYREPDVPMRLVRVCSALEGLALVGGNEKAHELAVRCAAAGGFGSYATWNEIYDRVRDAYRWRNAVVHGDAPPELEIQRAFLALEPHLLRIFMGFQSLFAGIWTRAKPGTVRVLRRELIERIDLFFLAPGLAI